MRSPRQVKLNFDHVFDIRSSSPSSGGSMPKDFVPMTYVVAVSNRRRLLHLVNTMHTVNTERYR